jgi:hypothetical protein
MRALKLPSSYTVCISPKERFVAALGRNVALADIKARRRLSSWHLLSHPADAAFSPDESLLAVKSTWGEMVVVETNGGAEVSRHRPKQQDEGSPLHFSPCGRFLVDGSWSGEIRVRRVEDLAVVDAFVFEGEMITCVSASADAKGWLVAHKPTYSVDDPQDRKPYLTLWEWPLHTPKCKFTRGTEGLDDAALSPAGDCIAVRGYSRDSDARELRLLSLGGDVIASSAVTSGGTGSNTRWSSDSRFVGTVGDGQFHVFSAPNLDPVVSIDAQYASDLAFINGGTEVFLGTWNEGRIIPLVR